MKKDIEFIKKYLVVLLSLFILGFNFDDNTLMLRSEGPSFSFTQKILTFSFIWKKGDRVGSDIGIIKDGKVTVITNSDLNNSLNEFPVWAEDGRKILYKSIREEGIGLYTYDFQSNKEKELTFFKPNNEKCDETLFLYSLWTPFKKIVNVTQTFEKNRIKYSLWLFDLIEKKQKLIDQNLSKTAIFRHTIDISADGRHLFYTKQINGFNDIWLRILNKELTRRRLTYGYNVTYLRISPKGDRILFVTRRQDKWILYVLNIDTMDIEKIRESNYINLGFPSWSGDGRLIILVDRRNKINIVSVENKKLLKELELKNFVIKFPILLGDIQTLIFYNKNSSIWTLDISGNRNRLKRIFP